MNYLLLLNSENVSVLELQSAMPSFISKSTTK